MRYDSACTVGQDWSERTSSSRDRSAAQQALWDGLEPRGLRLSSVTRFVTRRDFLGVYWTALVHGISCLKPLETNGLSTLVHVGGRWVKVLGQTHEPRALPPRPQAALLRAASPNVSVASFVPDAWTSVVTQHVLGSLRNGDHHDVPVPGLRGLVRVPSAQCQPCSRATRSAIRLSPRSPRQMSDARGVVKQFRTSPSWPC